eukprot:3854186-Karenia_brevis.AAC.1
MLSATLFELATNRSGFHAHISALSPNKIEAIVTVQTFQPQASRVLNDTLAVVPNVGCQIQVAASSPKKTHT